MTIGLLDLPAEIRASIYQELFRSSPIVCHQELETWESSDTESEHSSNNDVIDKSEDSVGESTNARKRRREESSVSDTEGETKRRRACTITDHTEDVDDMSVQVNDLGSQKTCSAILRTCKTIRQEAEHDFWTHTPFVIEHRVGHYIDCPGFEIDPRIRHLSIIQEPHIDLWDGTTSFLERHFADGGMKLHELSVSGDVFDDSDENELGSFLDVTLPHVDNLSFVMDVPGEYKGGQSGWYHPDRSCQVKMSPGDEVILVRSTKASDLEAVREQLKEAGFQPDGDWTLQWETAD